jgi:hypothetical protein
MSNKYNGYANYKTWNVCLWISNDERIYNFAKHCNDYEDFIHRMKRNGEVETLDSVAWNDSEIDLSEMKEFWQENF